MEPRRLSDDDVEIRDIGEEESSVPRDKTVFLIQSGGRYKLRVRPKYGVVSSIKMRTIPNLVHVTHSEPNSDGWWQFCFEVSHSSILRQPETILYDVESGDQRLAGEVPVCIVPPSLKYWKVAATFGVALTLQGAVALGVFLRESDFNPFSMLSEFRFGQNYNVLFLLSIPFAYVMLKVTDWLQYKWQS